jgi:hypothetical protein
MTGKLMMQDSLQASCFLNRRVNLKSQHTRMFNSLTDFVNAFRFNKTTESLLPSNMALNFYYFYCEN